MYRSANSSLTLIRVKLEEANCTILYKIITLVKEISFTNVIISLSIVYNLPLLFRVLLNSLSICKNIKYIEFVVAGLHLLNYNGTVNYVYACIMCVTCFFVKKILHN